MEGIRVPLVKERILTENNFLSTILVFTLKESSGSMEFNFSNRSQIPTKTHPTNLIGIIDLTQKNANAYARPKF